MYSRPSDSRPLSFIYIEDDGSGCTTNSDRYMRINMGKCRENKDSQMECPAMADWGTSSDSSAGKLAGFLDVVLLLSATFYLKIILRRQKISNFITKDNRSTAGILWSSRIPVIGDTT